MRRYLNGTKADELFALAEDLGQKVWVDMGACGWQEVGFFHLHRDGVDWVFVDHPSYQRPGALRCGVCRPAWPDHGQGLIPAAAPVHRAAHITCTYLCTARLIACFTSSPCDHRLYCQV